MKIQFEIENIKGELQVNESWFPENFKERACQTFDMSAERKNFQHIPGYWEYITNIRESLRICLLLIGRKVFFNGRNLDEHDSTHPIAMAIGNGILENAIDGIEEYEYRHEKSRPNVKIKMIAERTETVPIRMTIDDDQFDKTIYDKVEVVSSKSDPNYDDDDIMSGIPVVDEEMEQKPKRKAGKNK